MVIPAHGAQSLIGTIATAFVDPGTRVVIPRMTYGLYAQVCAGGRRAGDARSTRRRARDRPRRRGRAPPVEQRARMVWLCDPNNPTGDLIAPGRWSAFLDELPEDCIVVADEAYMDFADPAAAQPTGSADVRDGRPVIVIRSFSKIFGLAGLRLGYGVADPRVAHLLDVVQEPFNVNRIALAAGRAAVAVPGLRRAAASGGGRGARGAARRAGRRRDRQPARRTPTSCWSSWASTTARSATS